MIRLVAWLGGLRGLAGLGKRHALPMLLWCPVCGQRHIDADDMPAHKTHACQYCGMLWRPALIATHGVRFLPGCKDDAAERAHQGTWRRPNVSGPPMEDV